MCKIISKQDHVILNFDKQFLIQTITSIYIERIKLFIHFFCSNYFLYIHANLHFSLSIIYMNFIILLCMSVVFMQQYVLK